ncbi:MAG: SDR family NAD(P)-dependent oxidoreductase [Candidatus Roseilinea sp.]|uniref:SDR family NAD(P)-dependent oxidoreductase n=1 Tax=Candidatus Roseilinea sp. TaxID=2838777 RepID=UPI00404A8550
MNIDFTGQVVVVTGSGTGIGYAAAELFARCGAAVVVNGRRPQVVHEAADKIAVLGARVIAVPADVSAIDGAGRLIDETVKAFGSLDVLVNNAAIFATADFVESPYDEWRRVLDVNLDSAIHCSRAAAKVMIALGDDVSMIDNSYYITPPHTPRTHADWHHDVNLPGVYHPLSVMMVKVFWLLTDVNANSGGTAMVPGSHRLPMDFQFPAVSDPKQMPGAVQMTGKAGTAYLFNGRVYHCAVNNESDQPRKVLIYNYGHVWMKVWQGYEPSLRLIAEAKASGDPVRLQLLGAVDPYGASLRD